MALFKKREGTEDVVVALHPQAEVQLRIFEQLQGAANRRNQNQCVAYILLGLVLATTVVLITYGVVEIAAAVARNIKANNEWVTVKDKSTCWSIAQENGLSESALIKMNPGINCANLEIGTKIRVVQTAPICAKKYVVKPGEFCFKIWTAHGLMKDQFEEMNEGLNCNHLDIGQVVCVGWDEKETTISEKKASEKIESIEATTADNSEWITVKQGFTCWGIANSRKIPLESIIKMNPNVDCDHLQIGQRIRIPQSISDKMCAKSYTVKPKDSCYKIWNQFNLTEKKLKEMNEFLNCDSLQIGQVLCVSWEQERASNREEEEDFVTVKEENSCGQIANSTGIELNSLASTNSEIDCDHLKSGQKIRVSRALRGKPCAKTYKVKPQDYCYKIWRAHSLTERQFREMNGNLNCDTSSPGEIVCVERMKQGNQENPHRKSQLVTVKKGDSCWKIATSKGIQLQSLIAMNPDVNCDQLEIGQRLRVLREPVGKKCAKSYKVEPKDFCYKIWTDHKLSERQFREMNHGLDCDSLSPGQNLCVGMKGKRQKGNKVDKRKSVTIRNGDYCWQIANSNGIKVDALKSENPEIDCDILQVGLKIYLPLAPTNNSCTKTYKVIAEDNCVKIWEQHNITRSQFFMMNEHVNCDSLPIGQILCVSWDQN